MVSRNKDLKIWENGMRFGCMDVGVGVGVFFLFGEVFFLHFITVILVFVSVT